jgi:transposase
MKQERKTVTRYSHAFKQQVIQQIEDGRITLSQARRKYGIKGQGTIPFWIKRMGKLDLLPKLIRVEKPNEKDKIQELERQVRALKEALADTQLSRVIAESQFEVLCEQQGLNPEDVKKKLKAKPSSKR